MSRLRGPRASRGRSLPDMKEPASSGRGPAQDDVTLMRRDDYQSFMRSILMVDALALGVVALYLLVDAQPLQWPAVTLSAMVAFAAFVLAFRSPRFPARNPRSRILIEVGVMIVFITVVVVQTGGADSPLTNLFLLPVVLAAVTLGARATLVAVIATTLVWIGLLVPRGGPASSNLALFARLFGELGPLVLVAYLTERLASSIKAARRRIADLAERDGLTGLVNLRSFRSVLQHEHAARAARDGAEYALLMVDVDDLKEINDSFGHESGSAALRNVAEAIKRAIRASDVACRYGGDEFVVLLPGASALVAEAVAQRIRNAVFQSLFEAGGRLQRVSVSAGVGAYPRDGLTADEVLLVADRHMYQDKNLRRQPGDPEPPRPRRL